MTTPRLGAPELVSAQATPETTVNEQIRYLESAVGHFVLEDRDLSTPPGSPVDGTSYLVAGTGLAGWAGHDGDIAYYLNTAWIFINVQEGFTFWVKDENKFLVATSSSTFQEFATTTGGGTFEVPILASAMTARTSNGPATSTTEHGTNLIMLNTLDFDQSADEFAQFMFPMPKGWNEGTVAVQFIWTAAAGSGDVVWGARAVAISNDDALDAAFGTAQTVTDTLTATNDQCTSSYTSAITIGGSPAEGDLVVFGIYRDADNGSDTLNADAKLIGIRLKYTTNAVDDS